MFKFDDYPEIKKAHEINENFSMKMYAAEIKSYKKADASDDENWGKSIKNGLEFKTFVYSKIVFDVFAPLRPQLTMVHEGKKYEWDSVFGQDYNALSDAQKKYLSMMVENERPYRLPDEYYDERDKYEEFMKNYK